MSVSVHRFFKNFPVVFGAQIAFFLIGIFLLFKSWTGSNKISDRPKYSSLFGSSSNVRQGRYMGADSGVEGEHAKREYISLDALMEDPDFPNNVNRLEQEDPVLKKYVQLRHLTPPSKLPYALGGEGDFMNGHSSIVSSLFRHKKHGTFIEAGAYDGVAASNTIYFEKALGWSGLLVECNPYSLPELEKRRRKAWVANVCLSQTITPAVLNFSNPTKWAPSAKIGEPIDLKKWGIETSWTHFEVQAIPLFTLLSAINLTQIDFLSLDVEGAEFDVLKTIPFDKISIKVIDMEVHLFSTEEKSQIEEFLRGKGFRPYNTPGFTGSAIDRLYTHSSFHI